MQSMQTGSQPDTEDPSHQGCTMRQRDRIMLWSQRDLETSIEGLCRDLDDHLEFVELSKGVDIHGFKKQAAHIRYELMTIAKKIETKINDR
jgi:hypothetical protein